MSSNELATRTRIDSYLARLRSALGRLPADEVDDILREIRGHIAERADAAQSAGDSTIERILEDMGTPEQIGSLYRTEALVARARATFAPVIILSATIRWATKTLLGFIALVLGIVGYGIGLTLVGSAALKPFFPNHIGLWVSQNGVQLAVGSSRGLGPERLGWWAVPLFLMIGAFAIACTTLLLRWMLRFASRPSRISAVQA